jgi:hypothetical protein
MRRRRESALDTVHSAEYIAFCLRRKREYKEGVVQDKEGMSASML